MKTRSATDSQRMERRLTRRQELLKMCEEKWDKNMAAGLLTVAVFRLSEISGPASGGNSGTRRIRELKKDGLIDYEWRYLSADRDETIYSIRPGTQHPWVLQGKVTMEGARGIYG